MGWNRQTSRAVAGGRLLVQRLVGQHGPVGGHDDRDAEAGLEVGLLEVRVDRPRVGRLELGVGVDLLVSGVDRTVQPGPVAGVPAVGDDPQLVLPGEACQRDPAVRPRARRIDRRAIERDLAHGLGHQVHVTRRARLRAAEPDHRRRPEDLAAAREVQRDLVAVHGQQPGPLAGLGPRDLGDLHRYVRSRGFGPAPHNGLNRQRSRPQRLLDYVPALDDHAAERRIQVRRGQERIDLGQELG